MSNMRTKRYVVECHPQGWDEPFKREYFEGESDASYYAARMSLYYPRVLVICEVYEQGWLGCVDSYTVKSITGTL